MKEFSRKERKLALLGLFLLGVEIILYEFLVPTALMIRVFKAVLPVVFVLLGLFFVISLSMYAKDKRVLAESKQLSVSALDFPVTLKNGIYRDMSKAILVLDTLSLLFILLTVGGYFYQYKNTALYKYYPLIVTGIIVFLEVYVLIVYTMEGKEKDNSEYYNKLVNAQVEKDKAAEADALKAIDIDNQTELEDSSNETGNASEPELVTEATGATERVQNEETDVVFGDVS